MTPKSLVLIASMLTFVAISGEAFAAAETVHRRHPAAEAQHVNADMVQPENAYDTLMPPQAAAPMDHRYEGGPKSDIY